MRIRLLMLGLLGTCCVAAVQAQDPAAAPTREHLAPEGWEDSYHSLHYTPVVKIGERVIVSGIPAGGPGKADEEKIRWMFEQLEAHLEKAGATLEDVVELTSFHVATDNADFRRRIEPMLKVHREVFRDHYPAWTAVGTTALYSAGAPVELRAEAIIGSGRAAKAAIPLPKPPSPDK
ncbi:enamine deaminase RidA (YjgF/YER057c/UK114 family) [Luteimonas cucumeris]|uniref:Enamine deaminase RidA (YjgF/YER057c/UK114 family) n=1 Tax=Luteimonas cucumeris TaxID=985012 RepID=A0A562KUM4_9GAMM|nr:Rid family hydrolase [Luteimonas cucumeris]TWH99130.1 enamine deaminase RidA (YjgF/YER057c/UK114 family) [Luteimonas cucumeris]